MPPDDVAAATPTSDAITPGAAPSEAAATGGDAKSAAATPASEPTSKEAILEAARQMAREANLPEHQAIREERRKLKLAQSKFYTETKGKLESDLKAAQEELELARKDPFAYAAKREGVDELEIYNRKTKRAIDPRAAELDDVKKALAERDKRDKEREDADKAKQAEVYKAQVEHSFRTETIQLAESKPDYKLLQAGMKAGIYDRNLIANEVLRRVQAEYSRTLNEDGDGVILDSAQVLGNIESELREEAKRKRDLLAELEKAEATAIPDRGNGAVKPAAPEATEVSSPRTLTNAHASGTPAGTRQLTRKQRLIEAENKLLRGE